MRTRRLRFVEEVPMDFFGVNPAHVGVYLPRGWA